MQTENRVRERDSETSEDNDHAASAVRRSASEFILSLLNTLIVWSEVKKFLQTAAKWSEKWDLVWKS